MKPKHIALIVIDMQNDFTKPRSKLAVQSIQKHIYRLSAFITQCRDQGVFIVFTKHIYDGNPNPAEQELFPEIVKRTLHDGTIGAEIDERISPRSTDSIIKKKRYDAFFGTPLEQLLRKKKITHLLVTGTMTNICCETTARSAMMRDFRVIFCSDLTFCNDNKLHSATLRNIKSHFGKVMHSSKIIFP